MGFESVSTKAVGTVIRVQAVDDAIAHVVEMGFDRLVIERSTDLGLSWTEITTPSDRPVLKADATTNVWIDRLGNTNYLYRTRYLNTRTGELGTPGDSVSGAGIAAESILTLENLFERYLFGVDFRNDDGRRLPDSVFQFYILSALAYVEHQLDMKLLPTTFIEKQDYYSGDYNQFSYIQLDNYPIIDVTRFSVKYPTGQTVVDYPPEWIRVDPEHGQLRIVPSAGTLSQMMIGAGGSYLPVIYGGMGNLPHLFEIEYTAGFTQLPANVLDVVGMIAAMGPLNIFGDLIAGAGIANVSLSIDGLSQSIGTTSSATNAGYGSRIIQYTKQVKDQIPLLRKFYKGVRSHVA
jgi:hypothetical protein